IAESLDRSHTGAVNNVQFRETGPDELTLEVSSVKDCQLELWGVRHHESAFEKVFGKKLVVPLKSLNLS
ncbi:MAG TPA: hypothetical protein VHB77_03020, partial [Planctomycetaceae bacterium]|nr:hypothetical protein [Planctomycetaceae bacterium]